MSRAHVPCLCAEPGTAARPVRAPASLLRMAPLRISSPGDSAEREADRAAVRVMRGERVHLAAAPASPLARERNPPRPGDPFGASFAEVDIRARQPAAADAVSDGDRAAPAPAAILARKCAGCDQAEREAGAEIRRKPLGEAALADRAPPAVAAALRGPGRPLDSAARTYFEPRFGVSFADVRVHADSVADSAARTIDARAFTLGRRLGFAAGEYAPGTRAGRRLLAHELAHVAQDDGVPIELRRAPAAKADVTDCEGEDEGQVRAAVRLAPAAARVVANAIIAQPLPSSRAKALGRIFGATGVQNAAAIALRLLRIAQSLPTASYECENPGSIFYHYFCDDNLAYVRPGPALVGLGSIHICQPQFRGLDATEQMGTIIHEGAHRFLDADDEAYFEYGCQDSAETQALSDADRLDNADCYACLVRTVLQGGS